MELDDLESSVVNPRSRRDDEASKRDEKCRRRRFKSCCDEEFLNDLRDQERATKKECYREITGREHSHGSFDPFRCENAEKHRKEITVSGGVDTEIPCRPAHLPAASRPNIIHHTARYFKYIKERMI